MPHDKHGLEISVGDSVLFRSYVGGKPRVGTVYDVTPGATACNIRAVSAVPHRIDQAPSYGAAMILPASASAVENVAVLVDSGVLTASEIELVAYADGRKPPAPVTGPEIAAAVAPFVGGTPA